MFVLASLLCTLAGSASAATPGIATTLEDSSNSTPKEMTEGAAEMIAEIDAAVVTVNKLLETAKQDKKKDDELIKCLESKVPQLKTIQEIVGKTNTSMKQNLASGKTGRARSDYRQVAVLFSAAKETLVAAQACLKSAGGDPGKSSNTISGGEAAMEEIETEIPVDVPEVTTAY